MKKKTLTIIAALLAITQGAWAQTVVNDEAALNNAIAAADGEAACVRLGADITLSAYLKIGESKEQTVVLDLNGHKLRRSLGAVDANGHVIEVFGKGELTVKDTGKGGEISGGRANNGGGICNYGTLHLEGGTITGCYGEVSGGGVRNNGTMTMSGGAIRGCTSLNGGGIYNGEGATLTITGGAISGNTASDHAGAVYSKGDLSIANCTVTGNTAHDVGGIYNAAGGTAVITGCTLTGNTGTGGCGAIGNATASSSMAVSGCAITGNTAGTNGGGIWTGHTITVSDCTIKGNTAADNGGGIYVRDGMFAIAGNVRIVDNENPYGRNNLYLKEGKVVNFTDALSDDAVIGVSMEENGVFTNEYGSHNPDYYWSSIIHFFSDVDGYDLVFNLDGEGLLHLGQRKYYECSWDEANKRVVHTVKEIPAGKAVDNICSSKFANGGDLWGDTYWFIVDGVATIDQRLYCHGDVHIILRDNAQLTLQNGLMVNAEDEARLSIHCQSYGKSMGKLIVANNSYDTDCSDAGIGGSKYKDVGPIMIHGGDIYAKGGKDAGAIGGGGNNSCVSIVFIYDGKVEAHGGEKGAGIGGGYYRGNTITIYGGKVESHGGELGAGIGGGQDADGGTITISGGEVYAYGGDDAAGIGSGEGSQKPWQDIYGNIFYSTGGTITITGGRVEAHGGDVGAGIGGGQDISGGTITITGGEVYAYGGNDGAGIGSGEESAGGPSIDGGTITITGGYVYAEGNDVAAGIGAGEDADMGNITITGGIVEAYGGGGESWANAIASDDDNENVNSLTIGAGMKVTAGTREAPVPQSSQMVPFTGLSIKDQAPRAYRFARIEPCDHPGGGYTIIDGACHRIGSCGYCLMGGSSEAHAFGGDSKCVCGLLGLRDDADNTTVLARCYNTTQTVALLGGTFSQDSGWSALCLPFDLAPENMAFGNDGVQLKTLEKATFNTRTGTLTLHFADAGFVEAGRPCLVYWNGQSLSPVIPLFTNVTLKSLAPQDESPGNIVKFRGTYAPVTLKAGEPALYLDDEDRLRLPDSDTTVGAFHAWLQANTSSLGDVNSDNMTTVVDVTMLVDHILGRENEGFVVSNSDINGDEMVSVVDVTELVDIILHGGYNVKNVVVIGAGVLSLSTTSLHIAAGVTGTVEITSGSGSYEVESSDPDIATASIDGITVTVTAKDLGDAIITVTDTKSGQKATFEVTVSLCPDDHHPHFIDLGLPSGTKWSCCNEGASKPEDFGGYYPFGAVSSAPSSDQTKELVSSCTYEWTSMNGVTGGQFTGPSGGKIFLPAAGDVLYGEHYGVGSGGHYWSSTPYNEKYADDLYFNSSEVYSSTGWGNRLSEHSVRPVR